LFLPLAVCQSVEPSAATVIKVQALQRRHAHVPIKLQQEKRYINTSSEIADANIVHAMFRRESDNDDEFQWKDTDRVTFKAWEQKADLNMISLHPKDFYNRFLDELNEYKWHLACIRLQRNLSSQEIRNLLPNHLCINIDFAENLEYDSCIKNEIVHHNQQIPTRSQQAICVCKWNWKPVNH
jgi:hypothetical protein